MRRLASARVSWCGIEAVISGMGLSLLRYTKSVSFLINLHEVSHKGERIHVTSASHAAVSGTPSKDPPRRTVPRRVKDSRSLKGFKSTRLRASERRRARDPR